MSTKRGVFCGNCADLINNRKLTCDASVDSLKPTLQSNIETFLIFYVSGIFLANFHFLTKKWHFLSKNVNFKNLDTFFFQNVSMLLCTQTNSGSNGEKIIVLHQILTSAQLPMYWRFCKITFWENTPHSSRIQYKPI